MKKNDKPPIEVSFGGLFMGLLGLSFIILSSLRAFGIVKIEQLFLTCLSISGFSFALADYYLVGMSKNRKEKIDQVYLFGFLAFVFIGIMSIIVLPHFSFLKKSDLNLVNDFIILSGLGIIIISNGLKHWKAVTKITSIQHNDIEKINHSE